MFEQHFHDPMICSAFREVIDAYDGPFLFLEANQLMSLSGYVMKESAIKRPTFPRSIHVRCNYDTSGMRVKKIIAISNVTNVSTINSWSLQLWLINEALNLLTSFYVATWRSTCKRMYSNIKVDWRLSEILKVQRAWNIHTLASDAHLRKQRSSPAPHHSTSVAHLRGSSLPP